MDANVKAVLENNVAMSLGEEDGEEEEKEQDEERKEKPEDQVLPWLYQSLMDVEGQQLEVNEDSRLANEAEGFGYPEHDLIPPFEASKEMNLASINEAQTPENASKRLKMEVDFSTLVTQIQRDLEKAKTEYTAKHQTSQEYAASYQTALRKLENRAGTISHLQRLGNEEEQKHQIKIRGMEAELGLISGLVKDYRKELKESQKAFAQYRARNPKQEDEPVNRLAVEKPVMDFGSLWDRKFADLRRKVDVLDGKLVFLERAMKIVKELKEVRKFFAI